MMQPAKSCQTCYHCGSLTYGPECRFAAKELCCEDWKAPHIITVKAVIEVEIDLRALDLAYQMEFKNLKEVCECTDKTEEQYLLKSLQPDGIEIVSITDIEQVSEEGVSYHATPVKQREVIVV
jgi:hypothetical protein